MFYSNTWAMSRHRCGGFGLRTAQASLRPGTNPSRGGQASSFPGQRRGPREPGARRRLHRGATSPSSGRVGPRQPLPARALRSREGSRGERAAARVGRGPAGRAQSGFGFPPGAGVGRGGGRAGHVMPAGGGRAGDPVAAGRRAAGAAPAAGAASPAGSAAAAPPPSCRPPGAAAGRGQLRESLPGSGRPRAGRGGSASPGLRGCGATAPGECSLGLHPPRLCCPGHRTWATSPEFRVAELLSPGPQGTRVSRGGEGCCCGAARGMAAASWPLGSGNKCKGHSRRGGSCGARGRRAAQAGAHREGGGDPPDPGSGGRGGWVEARPGSFGC